MLCFFCRNMFVWWRKQKNVLKVKIGELIAKYEVDVKDMEEMTKPVKPENSLGRISRMDAINTKGVLEVSLRNKRAKLGKLRVAYLKVDEDDFGECVSCGNVIQEGRLLFKSREAKKR